MNKEVAKKITNPLVFIHFKMGHKLSGYVLGVFNEFLVFDVNDDSEEIIIYHKDIVKIQIINEQ